MHFPLRWLPTTFGLALGLAATAQAACPPPPFTPPGQVTLDGSSLLIVTHASSGFDRNEATKAALHRLVRSAKSERADVVYLQEANPYTVPYYFYDDCAPRHYVASDQGDFAFPITSDEVISAGGFFGLCKMRTVQQVLREWKRTGRRRDLKLTEIVGATYQSREFIRTDDSYYPAFEQLMAKSEGKPVTVLSVLKVIPTRALQLDYLRRYLDFLAADFPPTHRVVVAWDGLYQLTYRRQPAGAGRAETQPTLTIDFVTESE